MLLLGALLLALALLCTWGLARRRATSGTVTGRPQTLPALPLVGSLLQLAGHPQLHLRLWSLQSRYGSLYALWMGSHYVVVVNSYQHAREVLLKKGKAFAGRPRTVSRQQVLGGPPPTAAWGEAGDAPRKGNGTRQGPSPLPILPATGQQRGQPLSALFPRTNPMHSPSGGCPFFPRAGCTSGHGDVCSGTTSLPVPPLVSWAPQPLTLASVPRPLHCSSGQGKQSSWPRLCLPALTTSPLDHPWDVTR